MRRALLGAAAAAALVLLYPRLTQHAQAPRAKPLEMAPQTAFRVLLGVGDTQPATWNGNVQVTGGRVLSIQGWRFAGQDSTDYRATWQAATRHAQPPNAAARKAGRPGPMVENGVIIGAALTDPAAVFRIETAQGSFSFTAGEVPWGETRTELNGRVLIDRVPATTQLTTSREEQDFPAVAQHGDDVWVAFVEFVHGDRAQATQGILSERPAGFEALVRPVGGDQVMLLHYSKSRRAWDPAVPVSAARQDVMRAAVAVDGQGRVWVIWSANQKGNFDLYAKPYQAGKWGPETRLTSDAGLDANPVAATDAQGRVWVAWQGYRKGNLEILAAVQAGARFSAEKLVSFSPASDWDPSIAASGSGEVAVSWDTYDKGDYDVYFRRLRAAREIRMDAPVPVAASQNFEARPSLAYDRGNRLWVAYEASRVKWGKDFGAYETSGVALYQGHQVQVKCFEGDQAFATEDDLAASLPGPPQMQQRRRRLMRAVPPPAADPRLPNPELAQKRAPNATPQPPLLPLQSFPRLAADAEGALYLAVRTPGGAWRSPVGTVWFENLLYFDGAAWTGPIFVPRSDGLLDNRPALAALAPGHLLLVTAMDHRQSQVPGGGRRGGEGINSDIYAAEMRIEGRPQAAGLKPLPAESVAAPQAEVKPELEQVALMHKHRAEAGGQKLQLLRGEFHRHTEISGDGGRDGSLIDAYRYMIDAAYMDWGGCCDHDNGGGREYFWWLEQKLTDAYNLAGRYVAMFSYERSVRYPEGHRNVVFAQRGIRPLPRLPKTDDDSPPQPAPDTLMLYDYLKRFRGIAAVHTSGTDMGTDWRDNDPLVEPAVEIYQGDRQNYEMPEAPRSNRQGDSIGGWRPLGFVSLALQKGYRLGFQASSDHISTHMSYCNLWVTELTREAVMEAFRKRRLYGATDNILADVRCGTHFMGEEFSVSEPPALSIKLWGTAPFAKVHVIKDNRYVYTATPDSRTVDLAWKDNAAEQGKTSYYYVRGEQSDGELVWVSPMWITLR